MLPLSLLVTAPLLALLLLAIVDVLPLSPLAQTLLLILILLAIVGLFLSRIWIRRAPKKAKSGETERIRSEMERRKRTILEYAEEAMVKIYDISREQIAKLDNRATMLHILLSEAQQREENLKALINKLEQLKAEISTMIKEATTRQEASSNANFIPPVVSRILDMAKQGLSVEEISKITNVEQKIVEIILKNKDKFLKP